MIGTRNVTWPQAFQLDHKTRVSCQNERQKINRVPVRVISGKVWDRVSCDDDEAMFEIPDDLDQRFFVRDLSDFKEHMLRDSSAKK